MSEKNRPPVSSHFCAPIFYNIVMGVPWLLVIEYRFLDRRTGERITQIKFPGGMNKKDPDGAVLEDPAMTLDREAEEEVFTKEVSISGIAEDPVVLTFPDERVPGSLHEKHFYLVDANKCTDQIRSDFKQENDGVELGIPQFMHVSSLAGRFGLLHHTHQVALAGLILFLINEYEELRYTLDPKLIEWAGGCMSAQEKNELKLFGLAASAT